MSETTEVKAEVKQDKPEMPKPEQLRRQLKKMNNRQLAGHLRRRARTEQGIDGAKALILSIVFENTKPLGKISPYLGS
jgi:hypothetical protein